MPAYIIVEIDVLDPVGYEEYKNLASATVEKYGGENIVRGGRTERAEGGWRPKRIVEPQIEYAECSKQWLNCEENHAAGQKPHRRAQKNKNLVEGIQLH